MLQCRFPATGHCEPFNSATAVMPWKMGHWYFSEWLGSFAFNSATAVMPWKMALAWVLSSLA